MTMLRAPERIDRDELIDATGHDLDELAHSLRQVARVDRVLGGERGVRRALSDTLRSGGAGPLTLLDVGAGNGQVARRLGDWLGHRRRDAVTVVAVDAHPDVIEVGRIETPGVAWVQADGRRLPLDDGAADIVTCVLTLHHFARSEAVRLLRELARVARLRVVVSDLERSRAHWVGARLLAATLWRGNRLTRADGPTSVLRGWTRDELRSVMDEAGLEDVRVHRHVPWRLVASGRPRSVSGAPSASGAP